MPKVRWLGHACFLITSPSGNIIIDPFIKGNPQCPVSIEQLPKLDSILVTHGHGDHLGDAIELCGKHDALLVSTYELCVYCQTRGVQKVHPMHIGGAAKFSFGTVKLVPALHGSAVTHPNIVYTGEACGFIVTIDGSALYHAGDTALFSDMELIGRCHSIDCAMLPIGDNFTMGIDDAVIAATMLHPKRVVPMHYDTFPVIKANPFEFARKLKEASEAIQCHILKPGEELEI
ncbi:MAG: metal-dependent hydrolase [Armatimonadota bacterium]|nr:metal-dependent hydrolase [Armatimonadota bacterium]MCX7778394.1 metal-dependent hydrolase [Armatimonadota bacterium]MDW8026263.1 metal-dependent hydrolase [Armatimonadota bacterium]